SRRRHTRFKCDWSSDVCSSDLGRSARSEPRSLLADDASRAAIVADVKRQLQSEMGLLPLTLLRERRNSFVELYSYDDKGSSNYRSEERRVGKECRCSDVTDG